eukprot:TRINITY_DN3270_c0_g1_i1.p1 TRINITY_DN3270_c0_g1~~TRINITY_DN3270_c0_g1_i1.p1  ORF type:complete len:645 (+),score=174.21 TRINITY_DN3270_c0_g1_i1:200-1936(+)
MNLPTSFGMARKDGSKPLPGPSRPVPGPQRSAPGPQRSAPGPQRSAPGPKTSAPPTSVPIEEPSGINRTEKEEESSDEDDDDMIGPKPPKALTNTEENSNFYSIPYSHEIKLKGHERTVCAIALDPSGSRLLTGGYDNKVKMWDFAGMDTNLRSFREIEPAEGNKIKSIQYSITGDRFLVTTGNSQAKLYDRDGHEKAECVKGDMYLADRSNTKGHVTGLGNGMWHPSTKDRFVTCSLDCTVRVWDVPKMGSTQTSVIKVKTSQGRNIPVTQCSYSPDGKMIAAASQDGSLQFWQSSGPFSRPSIAIREAHIEGSDITSICFHQDNQTMLSRCMDDTMKVWDIRKPKEPVAVFSDLPNVGVSDCMISPDGRLYITGTAVRKGEKATGLMVFYDRETLKKVKQIGISQDESVTCMLWHPKINQIAFGTSDCIHMFYDPALSNKGALLSVSKAPRVVNAYDFEPARPVVTPHALPLFADATVSATRKEARKRYDPSRDLKDKNEPLAPTVKSNSLTQHLLKHHIRKDISREEDPREALLKYNEEAEQNPFFFGNAYKKTQPVPQFQTEPELEPGRVKKTE